MNYHDLSLSLIQGLLGAQETRKRTEGAASTGEAVSPAKAVCPLPAFTITISRETGAFGHTVAELVGQRLDWPIYDGEILNRIAQEMQRPTSVLAAVDERPMTWLEECLASLVRPYHIGSDVYLKYLIAAVRGLGAKGQCVIVGRGANFILPAETTLRVRLVASTQDRMNAIRERFRLSAPDAAAWMATTERHRLEFVRRAFRQDAADPHHYDLMLNLSRLRLDEAVDTIADMLHRFENHCVPAQGAAGQAPAVLASV